MLLPSNFLVAVDFNPSTERLLDTAFALADRLDGKVHLIHAFTLTELSEAALRGGGLDTASTALEQRLHGLGEGRRAGGRLGEMIVREGDPNVVVNTVAKELHVDLILVDTYHRGITRLTQGSVTDHLIHSAPCAVLVLRHDAA